MVDGRVLWDGVRVRTLDEAKVVRDAEEWRKKVAASLAACRREEVSLFVRTIIKKRDGQRAGGRGDRGLRRAA